MPGNSWKCQARKLAFDRRSIRMTDAACFNVKAHLAGARRDNCSVNDAEHAWRRHFHCPIGSCHLDPSSPSPVDSSTNFLCASMPREAFANHSSIFYRHKAYSTSNVTKSYGWRIAVLFFLSKSLAVASPNCGEERD